jgi:hypothetical protein
VPAQRRQWHKLCCDGRHGKPTWLALVAVREDNLKEH